MLSQILSKFAHRRARRFSQLFSLVQVFIPDPAVACYTGCYMIASTVGERRLNSAHIGTPREMRNCVNVVSRDDPFLRTFSLERTWSFYTFRMCLFILSLGKL